MIRETGGSYRATELVRELEQEMLEAAEKLQFEKAAILRDQINELKTGEGSPAASADQPPKPSRGKRKVKYDRQLKVNVIKKGGRRRKPEPTNQ